MTLSFPPRSAQPMRHHRCIKALAAGKHLASYVSGTERSRIRLRRCEPYDTVLDNWNESELVGPDFRQDRSLITIDTFSSSSWDDGRFTKKSTTASMIFLNGCLIHNICRPQTTIVSIPVRGCTACCKFQNDCVHLSFPTDPGFDE